MNLAEPFEIVTPTLDGCVLAALARTEATFTTGQVQRVVGKGSIVGLRKVLERLARQGIVRAERTPAAVLYSLNRQHVGADAVIALADLRGAFLDRVTSRIRTWPVPPAFAAVFGSAARGEMRWDSDVDLFVVRPRRVDADDEQWRAGLDGLSSDATQWSGNDVRILEYGEAELARSRRSPEPVVTRVLAEGLPVCGSPTWLRRQVRRER